MTRSAAPPLAAFQPSQAGNLSRGEQAYARLRDAIQSGQLLPGTRLREVDVAQWLGISRTPVREALARLLSEGLAFNESPRGMVVAELDQAAVSELYVMRENLEGTAANLAAQHASAMEIDRRDGVDAAQLARNNRLFHDTLYRSAHNRFLLKTLASLHESMALLGQTTLSLPGRSSHALKEHEAIVNAIRARDAAKAEAAARAHIRAAYQSRLQVLFASPVAAPTHETI
jgi:DNA-binding GntR family transcriptional regulator